jgi:hypothetical protein
MPYGTVNPGVMFAHPVLQKKVLGHYFRLFDNLRCNKWTTTREGDFCNDRLLLKGLWRRQVDVDWVRDNSGAFAKTMKQKYKSVIHMPFVEHTTPKKNVWLVFTCIKWYIGHYLTIHMLEELVKTCKRIDSSLQCLDDAVGFHIIKI